MDQPLQPPIASEDRPFGQPPLPPRKSSARWVIPLVVFGPLLVACCCCCGVVWSLFGLLKSNDVYQMAVAKVTTDGRVIAELGEPITVDWMITGDVNLTNDRGEAKLHFGIKGPKGTGEVDVQGARLDSHWTLEHLKVHTRGPEGEKEIVLVPEGSTGMPAEEGGRPVVPAI
jgi:hypothetical protein